MFSLKPIRDDLFTEKFHLLLATDDVDVVLGGGLRDALPGFVPGGQRWIGQGPVLFFFLAFFVVQHLKATHEQCAHPVAFAFLMVATKKCRSSARTNFFFVPPHTNDTMLKHGLKGMLIGGAVGATAGVTVHILQRKGPAKPKESAEDEEKETFQYIEGNSEARFHVGELAAFGPTVSETGREAIAVLRESLDRLIALEQLSGSVGRPEDAKPSWPLTAQHYANEVADGLRLLKTQLTAPTQQVAFDLHAAELQTLMNNLVYNVGMNVQAHMNAGVK